MSERCVTVQEAQNDIRMIVWKSRETEEVTLLEAGGRILSENLRAGKSSPFHDLRMTDMPSGQQISRVQIKSNPSV